MFCVNIYPVNDRLHYAGGGFIPEFTITPPPSGDSSDWRNSPEVGRVLEAARDQGRERPDCLIQMRIGPMDFSRPDHLETLQILDDGRLVPYVPPRRMTCSRCSENRVESEFPTRSGRLSDVCRECTREERATRKRIRTEGRRFGVEIECVFGEPDEPEYDDYGDPVYQTVPSHQIAQALEEAGIAVVDEGYTHRVMPQWKIVSDSSVEEGWEIVSPPLLWKDRDQIRTVCRVLRDLGASIDHSCGLHVHHEVADYSLTAFKRLYRKWAEWQPYHDALTAPSRRGGQYSGYIDDYNARHIRDARNLAQLRRAVLYTERYQSLNVTCFPSYGTVEVRQHQGSINAEKIIAWVAYGQAIVDACTRRVPSEINGQMEIGEFLAWLPIKEEEQLAIEGGRREYLERRAEELNGGIRRRTTTTATAPRRTTADFTTDNIIPAIGFER